jgi:hypothetical protein
MENKFQPSSVGRVGGVRPPYRDQHISKITSVICGLDTLLKEHSELLDQRGL